MLRGAHLLEPLHKGVKGRPVARRVARQERVLLDRPARLVDQALDGRELAAQDAGAELQVQLGDDDRAAVRLQCPMHDEGNSAERAVSSRSSVQRRSRSLGRAP